MSRKFVGKHMFTKDEAKTLLTLWETKSTQEIADDLGLEKGQVQYLAMNMRKAGFQLPRKRVLGQLRAMLVELKQEIKTR